MGKCLIHFAVLLLLVPGLFIDIFGEAANPDSLITLELNDGSILRGKVIAENPDSLVFKTISGLKISLPHSIVTDRTLTRGRLEAGQFYRFDPNYTRLLFTPTGRPLGKGEGYFTDYYVFFPGVAYGITNRISFMAGCSILPGVGIDEQLFYIAPRYGREISDMIALSAGFLYLHIPGGYSAGITFVTGTYGLQDRSLTTGLGWGFTYEDNEESDREFEFAKHPIFVWGGNARVSNSISLVSENWLIGGWDFENQPFSVALRFFGEHIAVDIGAVIMFAILEEGFPIPWLSFVYNFG